MSEIVDRISGLPEHIIREILGKIPCGEDRTSILSKTWLSIWRRRPDVNITHNCFSGNLEEFVRSVDDLLKPYAEENLRIEKLWLQNLKTPALACHVDRWLKLAIQQNLTSLHIGGMCCLDCTLPVDATTICAAAKTLTELHLFRCKFENNNVQQFIGTCPFIRDLKLSFCTGIHNLHVFGNNLENLVVESCKGLHKLEIQAPKFRKFLYFGLELGNYGGYGTPCNIDISDGYNTLQFLHLENAIMTEQQFEYHLSKFSSLQILKIQCCIFVNIEDEVNLGQINMFVPNLKKIYWEGYDLPFFISSIDPSNLEQVDMLFHDPRDVNYCFSHLFFDDLSYNKLQDFIQKFNYSNGFILLMWCEEDDAVIIYEDPREILIPQTKELLLQIKNPSMRLESFVNDVLCSHSDIISILPSIDSKILQMLHTVSYTMKQKGELIEVTNHKGAVEDDGTSTSYYSWLNSTSLIDQITTYTFEWNLS